ncbi:hypothetical protein GPK34_09425 [Secundilactobacillus kimchicus]|uniref:Phage holin, LL-H family n=1 Tax=Secundilactobacillus kimchicus JCM 15530 TaxID=1302272 RepID=A0A0R1HLW9_9LACO|nr:phage holin, LLH family [Secundilactobacillus kimchicus]KRK47355.1 hypothetical protein FC96_GL002474 [Secundilactobacillus kimchicus JCM 15530]MBT9672252.1 hypothetical protein [Secundilactobacillus kimchicus]
MSEILSWIQWLDKNGVIAFLGTALFVAYKLLHPIAQAKLQDETSSIKVRTLQIADDLAATIVPELALMSTLSNEERKAEAIKFINRKLSLLDLQLTEETVSAKVEKAYQEFKDTPLKSRS